MLQVAIVFFSQLLPVQANNCKHCFGRRKLTSFSIFVRAGTDGFAQFIQEMGLLGFDLRSKDLSNSVFCVFQFQRTKREPDTLRFTWSFEPWVYKKR